MLQGTDCEVRLGNAVLVLTRLPTSHQELAAFISGASATKSGRRTNLLKYVHDLPVALQVFAIVFRTSTTFKADPDPAIFGDADAG